MTDLRSTWPPQVDAFFRANPTWIPGIPSHVPQGWDSLVATALERLLHLSRETGVDIKPAQIKEKFAGLRLYLNIDEASAGNLEIVEERVSHTHLRSSARPGSVRAWAQILVDAAATSSRATCMTCGRTGQTVSRAGYLTTACADHADGGSPVEDRQA